jgi:hypothetical protein
MIEQCLKNTPELLVAQSFFKTRTGVGYGPVVVFVGKHARVQRPLPAPPWSALMDSATSCRIIKDAMTVTGLHLHNRAC